MAKDEPLTDAELREADRLAQMDDEFGDFPVMTGVIAGRMRARRDDAAKQAPLFVSARLLLDLHALLLAGRDQLPEADAIRSAMEGPWRQMTEAERAIVEEISAALNARTNS